MTPHGLLIFDLDGTLFETTTVWLPATCRGFSDLGLAEPDEPHLRSFIGKPVADFRAWIYADFPGRAAELIAAIDRHELALIPQGRLYPGVREGLAALRAAAGHMAICTNGSQDYVERVVEAHDLGRFFDLVRFRQPADDGKPGMIRDLLSRLDSRPALVIGDRYHDIEAARQNGIRSIAALYGYGSPEELQHADGRAQRFADLPTLVRRLLDAG
jgi:phosphoglycolate phosphatase